jgi:hypothetical protein
MDMPGIGSVTGIHDQRLRAEGAAVPLLGAQLDLPGGEVGVRSEELS